MINEIPNLLLPSFLELILQFEDALLKTKQKIPEESQYGTVTKGQ